MDYAALAQAAVAFLTPHFLSAAGKAVDGTLDAARQKVADWLKTKFTKPAQAGALQVAARAPDDADALDALRHQIERALQHDEAFRNELQELLPQEVLQSAQSMDISGSNNIAVQSAGSGSIVIQK